MKTLFQILLLSFLILPFCLAAQDNSDSIFIRKISDEMLRNGKAYDLLRHLSKNIGGRLTGSPELIKAIDWSSQTFHELGADTVYLQECKVPHWVRGGEDKASLVSVGNSRQKRPLSILALGNSLGTGKKGVTAEVIAVESFDELEKRKDEVKGKIVFYNVAFNPTDLVPGASYGRLSRYRGRGASRAAKYGAIGMLIRSLSSATDNYPHTGAMVYNDSFPKIPAAALGLHDADFLWNACKQNNSVKVSFTTHGSFLSDTISYNVIAELKGSTNVDEYITTGGHLDSWDVNEGAHDDGAGVVQTIEIMRTLKVLGYKPKHTMRFVLFTNEENGLRGGETYAAMAQAKNEKHVFALESDAGGFSPRGFSFLMDNSQLQKVQQWQALLQPYGTYQLFILYAGADITPLHEKLNTPVSELITDNQRYFDLHHAATDVFEAVNRRELLLGAVNMAGLIYLIDKYGL